MIDWLTLEVPYPHTPIPASKIMKVGVEGNIEWVSAASYQVEGSFDSSVYVRSVKSESETSDDGTVDQLAGALRIDGNPSKFLQGHNIFGSMDAYNLARSMVIKVLSKLEIPYTFDMMQRIGEASITRVDITKSFELRSRSDVLAWLRAAEYKSRSRSGRPQSKGSTLYFNKTSRRWAFKFYSKGQELQAGKKHQLPSNFSEDQKFKLQTHADRLLRAELTLRSMELKQNGILTLNQLTEPVATKLYSDYLGRIEMNAQAKLPDDKAASLPRFVSSTYMLWKEGVDLRQVLPKNTFYRHRRHLLSEGIDISIACDDAQKTSNVVPLIRVLEAKPVDVPNWAYTENLIYQSNTTKSAAGSRFPTR